jgi:intracellular multiplication protein IcmL
MSHHQQDSGLALVLARNGFYRDAYRRVVIVLAVLFFVNVGLLGAVLIKAFTPAKPQYFATTADGRMLNSHKLSDPVVTDSFVTQWVANSVRRAFSVDYVHWRKQLQDASVNFTPDGWRYFLGALKSSNNLNTLLAKKMVSSAVVTSAPQITAKMVVSGHYAWKVEMPLLITYTDGKGTTQNMPWKVTVIVLRMPVKDYPQRIAINNFLPQVEKS